MSEIYPDMDPALQTREVGRRLWVMIPDSYVSSTLLFASRIACKAHMEDNWTDEGDTVASDEWSLTTSNAVAYLVEVR